MLINHRTAQLGVVNQKPFELSLVSRSYPLLVVEDGYEGTLKVLAIRKFNLVVQGLEAYSGGLSVTAINKQAIVKRTSVTEEQSYVGGLSIVSIMKKDIVVNNISDDKTGYIGSLSVTSINKSKV